MKHVTIAGHKVVLYDGIDEIPVSRANDFSLYLMMDADIGSDADSINRHISRLVAFIERKDYAAMAMELSAYGQNLQFIVQNLSPEYMAFCAMIESINGEKVTDTSPDGVARIMAKFADAPKGMIRTLVDELKKKRDDELNIYFPGKQSQMVVKYYQLLKARTLAVLDQLENDTDREAEIKELDIDLLTLAKPRRWDGPEGVEVKHRKEYADMCIALSTKMHTDPATMTELQFFQAIEHITKQHNGQ